MPAEIRHILFERLEVVQAVRESRAARGEPPLLGSVVHSEVVAEDSSGSLSFKITVQSDGNRGPVTRSDVVIGGPALAAALIFHCRRTKIPLPAHAEKSMK